MIPAIDRAIFDRQTCYFAISTPFGCDVTEMVVAP